MASLEGTSKKPVNHLKQQIICVDDRKVIGQIATIRRDKAGTYEKFHTLKMRTQNSARTPVANKASSEQIFKEKRDLISHWFDLWNDPQRRHFLNVILQQCRRSQYRFLQNWLSNKAPLKGLDFMAVLPRFLSCYIFSFLDPKSLCRCAQVSWHWKFVSEQEAVWIPLCLKLGWFLPYEPADNEYGAWKRHYVACIHTLNSHILQDRSEGFKQIETVGMKSARNFFLYAQRSLSYTVENRLEHVQYHHRSDQLSQMDRRRLIDIRPPWKGPDFKPKDLIRASKSINTKQNPNDPVRPQFNLILHNKYGIKYRMPEETFATKSLDFEIGMDSSKCRESHRKLLVFNFL